MIYLLTIVKLKLFNIYCIKTYFSQNICYENYFFYFSLFIMIIKSYFKHFFEQCKILFMHIYNLNIYMYIIISVKLLSTFDLKIKITILT